MYLKNDKLTAVIYWGLLVHVIMKCLFFIHVYAFFSLVNKHFKG